MGDVKIIRKDKKMIKKILAIYFIALAILFLPGCADCQCDKPQVTTPVPPTGPVATGNLPEDAVKEPTAPAKPPVVAPTPPPAPKKITLAWGDKAEWTAHTLKEVKDSGIYKTLPKDVADFCPNYKFLNDPDRFEFWAQFISIMTKWESSYNTNSNTPECRTASCVYSGGCDYKPGYGYCMKGGHKLDDGIVISRGLLQISLQSAQGYGCAVSVPKDLNDPLKNLSCGVKILNRFIPKDVSIAGKLNGSWQGATKYWAVLRGTTDYTKKSLEGIKGYTKNLTIYKEK